MASAIRVSSGERLDVDTGSLYPALHRLEREGSIDSEWKVSENKQRVKVYRLTPAGRRKLAAERSRWAELLEAMGGVLGTAAKQGAE
jgi:DNA-binding PadR family transcriptional regulator